MPRRFGRPTPPVVLAAVVLGLAGCGGGPGTLSTGGYESQGVEALKPLLSALGSLKIDPASTSGWKAVERAAREASRSFERIRSPSSLGALNSKLSDSLDAMGKAAGQVGADISKQDTAAASADAARYKAALRSYGDVINELGKRGVKFSGT